MDARVRKMAEVLVNYSVEVRRGDWVVIQTTTLGEPMARACASAVVKAGGFPSVLLGSEEIQEAVTRESSEEQLAFISPLVRTLIEDSDCQITLLAPSNTRNLAGIDPRRLAIQSQAMAPLVETYMQRSSDGSLRWTIAAYPTPAAAQDAGMSLHDYEDFVFGAGLIQEPDPPAAWKELAARQQRLVEWLQDKRTIHVEGPGTDLTVSVGRPWINDDAHKNFPGGEVFTSPLEEATEGTIEFTYPAYLRGREVVGARLVFERGSVVEASATSGQDFLEEMLNLDDGARRLGEFAFGTNPGIQTFVKNTLFDEKIGGTLHMALGHAFPEIGGTNESALHWDMVYNLRDGATVTVDGQPFSRNGEFLV